MINETILAIIKTETKLKEAAITDSNAQSINKSILDKGVNIPENNQLELRN